MVEREDFSSLNQEPEFEISRFSLTEKLFHDPSWPKKKEVAFGVVTSVFGIVILATLVKKEKLILVREELQEKLRQMEFDLSKRLEEAFNLQLHKETLEVEGTFLNTPFKISVPELIKGCFSSLESNGSLVDQEELTKAKKT